MKMSVDELITELSMNYSCNMHIILEGADDEKLFRSVLEKNEKVNFLSVGGSDSVIELVEGVDAVRLNGGFPPVLGIIDRDYREALGKLPDSVNVLMSDLRDVECMMFGSPVFFTVLSEYGSAQKIQKLGGGESIKSIAVNSAIEIGKLRFYSQQSGLNTSFKKLEIGKLVSGKSMVINGSSALDHLNRRQEAGGRVLPKDAVDSASAACIAVKCNQGKNYFSNDLLLCRGHDLMELMAIGFRSLFGTRSASESSRENVETLFRLGYTAHFRHTKLAKDIEKWLHDHGLHPNPSLI